MTLYHLKHAAIAFVIALSVAVLGKLIGFDLDIAAGWAGGSYYAHALSAPA